MSACSTTNAARRAACPKRTYTPTCACHHARVPAPATHLDGQAGYGLQQRGSSSEASGPAADHRHIHVPGVPPGSRRCRGGSRWAEAEALRGPQPHKRKLKLGRGRGSMGVAVLQAVLLSCTTAERALRRQAAPASPALHIRLGARQGAAGACCWAERARHRHRWTRDLRRGRAGQDKGRLAGTRESEGAAAAERAGWRNCKV